MARTANPVLAEKRRNQIMEAALSCFRRRGFHQTSMQEICHAAQMSAGAIYRYFPSKTDIIAAIAAEDGKKASECFVAVETGDELIEALVHAAEAFVSKIVHRGDAPLMGDILSEALRDPDVAASMRAAFAPLHARLTKLIAEAQRRGEFDKTIEPERAARWVFGVWDGMCMRAVMHRRKDSAEIGRDIRALLERMLRPTAAPKSVARSNREKPRREKMA
jgi:AcrR family transcriptional regulator